MHVSLSLDIEREECLQLFGYTILLPNLQSKRSMSLSYIDYVPISLLYQSRCVTMSSSFVVQRSCSVLHHCTSRKISCCSRKPFVPVNKSNHDKLKTKPSYSVKPLIREWQKNPVQITNVWKTTKRLYVELLDALVDSMYEVYDQPYLPTQSNFKPVDELKEAVNVSNSIEGEIPGDFQEGVYIRNGPNPIFGHLKSTKSIFGRTSYTWVEGEGMLHATYFDKGDDGRWNVVYKNRYVETDTYKREKLRNKLTTLPAAEGDSLAVLAATFFNMLRYGKGDKILSNTGFFKYAGKCYAIAENYFPQLIDVLTLDKLGDWNPGGAWNRAFTSHPKIAPHTGEMVILGIDANKPYLQFGVISANGQELVHKVDTKLTRSVLSHEVGVTERYNVIFDFPLTIDVGRVIKGGTLIKYVNHERARIGVMPRYGDSESIKWFDVETHCTLHIFNCFEDDGGDEVVVWGCRAISSIILGPDYGENKFEWFSNGFKDKESDTSFFTRVHEWRLNMKTGRVKEKYLTGTKISLDFPIINEKFTGLQNKYGYTQVVDSIASSKAGMAKYGGLGKIFFEEQDMSDNEGRTRVEYHHFEKNTFCSGAVFVAKEERVVEEDDGWIVAYVHNEDTNISQVYVIDAKAFTSAPVAKIALPCRVPYGFHGAFIPRHVY